MDVLIPITVLFSILCYSQRRNEYNAKSNFIIAIIVLCALLSVRYEFGPDYFNYRNIYNGAQGEDLKDYTGAGSTMERPFLYLLQLFPSFTSFVCFLTVFWFSTNLYFITHHISPQYYWAVLLFMVFEPTYLLLSSVAMRTTLCASLFLIALEFLLRGKRIIYILIIILASMFHSSTIALIVFALITDKKNTFVFNTTICYIMGIVALISIVVGENVLIKNLSAFFIETIEDLDRYSNRKIGGVSQSFNSLLFKIMSFSILLYINKSRNNIDEPKTIILNKIAIIAVLLQLFLGQSIVSDRFLSILNPVYICAMLNSIKYNEKRINSIIFIFVVIVSVYMFYSKITKDYSSSFLVYHSVFSAPFIP